MYLFGYIVLVSLFRYVVCFVISFVSHFVVSLCIYFFMYVVRVFVSSSGLSSFISFVLSGDVCIYCGSFRSFRRSSAFVCLCLVSSLVCSLCLSFVIAVCISLRLRFFLSFGI